MTSIRFHIILFVLACLTCCPAMTQTVRNDAATVLSNHHTIQKSIKKNNAMLDKFSNKCERRTQKAEKRFARYERKMTGNKETSSSQPSTKSNFKPETSNSTGLGKEPLLDSLRLIYGFTDYAGISENKQLSERSKTSLGSSNQESLNGAALNRAQQQLNITQRTKSELLERKDYYKAQVKEHPDYGKWLGKMEKERYYYTTQINEYRKTLRDPSNLDDKLMDALRRDPRFSDFAAALPAKPQNPEKMQPRQLVKQMMQSQAEAIDPDPEKLLSDAKTKGKDLLGNLSNQSSLYGSLDNAAQMPKFTPNPYKTKSFWQRIDVGFNLQFDNRTLFLPSTGVAGAQASFNFDPRLSIGALANYRFGMGEIKNIQFSHAGAGYGAFANYKIWKALGVQSGYERNWRAEMEMNEIRYPAAWTSSALVGLTYEYGIGKKAKATVGVFFDALYKQHTPETNAVLWRMGW